MGDLTDLGLLAGRIMLAAVYLYSAFDKFANREAAVAEMAALRLPQPELMRIAVVATQAIGGLMVLLGVHARLGAIMLAGFTILATWLAHRPWEHVGAARGRQINIALEHIAIIGGFLVLAAAGPGRYAIAG